MEYCKLQICCLIVTFYVTFIYYRGCSKYEKRHKFALFDILLVFSTVTLLLDGATAYAVNHFESIGKMTNMILHMLFFLFLDSLIYLLFIYIYSAVEHISKRLRIIFFLPFVVNIFLVVFNIGSLEYRIGKVSNYSMGVSAYTCFITAGLYIFLAFVQCIRCWDNIESHKRISIFTYMLVFIGIIVFQAFVPEALVSSLGIMVIVLGSYLNMEDPAVTELSYYHNEMVMGFATLVENKDNSTGGHIRRTTAYVKLLVQELRKRGYYKKQLTRDYTKNLLMAAPMHDIGKIAIPDVILQKPGKLTDEEFEMMKTHTVAGGKIIQETFGHLENKYYREMAYEVALHHHEKWDGTGYPDGLKRQEIPLCARIMAIADVFDAVSENRCYRAAMPLEKCFQIIKEGSGQYFDPILAGVFLDIKDRVKEVHDRINDSE